MTTTLCIALFTRLSSLNAFELVPFIAQVTIDKPIDDFLKLLAKIFLILGALIMAYGAYLIHQGRISEGLLSLLAGLLLALAIPLMRLFMQWAGAL